LTGDPDLSHEEGKQQVLDSYRRRTVERALKAMAGSVSQATKMRNPSRAAFQRILRQLDIDRRRFAGAFRDQE
jgi:hypothetical protein